MIERLVISGFGGQGIMFLGKLIAWVAMREQKFVTFLPAYGAEVRGGTSHCSIIISDKEIASPYVDSIDTLIAMNSPSVIKFIAKLKRGSDVFVNSAMVENIPHPKGVNLYLINFSEIAFNLGSIKSANMVALGAYLAKKNVISAKSVIKVLPQAFKHNNRLVQLNKEALRQGEKILIERQ